MYKKYEKCCVIAGGREVPAETFAGAHPSGWRRHLPFTGSWVTTGLRRDLPTDSKKTHGRMCLASSTDDVDVEEC